jgi:hypothetical protein
MHAIAYMGCGVLMHYTIEQLHAVGTVRSTVDNAVVYLQSASFNSIALTVRML